MAIIFLLLSFLSFFGTFFVSYKEKKTVFTKLRLAFIKTSLIISFLTAVFTELLSFFGVLTPIYIKILWSAVFVISLIILIYAIKKNKESSEDIGFRKIILFFKKETLGKKIILISCLVVILSLACVSFTLNYDWDSYTYHLPKVEHWIQDKNVDFFPTNNIRQLYLAPFAEYFVLNLRLLSGNALFINFVQFFAFLNCIFLVSLIAKFFDLSPGWQLLSSALVLTLPVGLMQSATTSTDISVSFFIISFVYFGISIIKEKRLSIENIFFLSLSFSLGILTKSTFYIFALPFCLVFGFYYIKFFKLKSLYILFTLLLVFSLLNLSFLIRNYRQFGSIFGPQKTSPLYLASLNGEFGFKVMLSNSVKNIGTHLALPSDAFNGKVAEAAGVFHGIIGYPMNSMKTNWFGMEYKTIFFLGQNANGNFLHTVLFFVVLAIIFVKFRSANKLVLYYSLALVSGFLFFAFLLKWQPWQARLDLPGFVLMAPLVAYALSLVKWKKINEAVSVGLLISALGIVMIFDPIKPIFGKNSIFLKDNSAYIYNYAVAKEVETELGRYNITNTGFVLGQDAWEWEYWFLSKNRRFEYVFFPEILTKTPNFDPNFGYRALIIDNAYLAEPRMDSRIDDFIADKKDILETKDIGNSITLVIYKTEQSQIITY
jgi:hypothetical protein